MSDIKRQWLPRMLIGGCAGMVFYLLLGCAIGGIGYFNLSGFRYVACRFYGEREPLGILLSLVLFALFGAEVGVATMPFAGSGRELVTRSLLHFALTAITVSVWAVLNFGMVNLPFFLVPLTLVYILVWLGRWVGWFFEVSAIREKLGLAPGPSLFHWRESLPYVGFACLLCLALPTALRLMDAADVPVLSVLYAWLLLPVGGFMSGLSLGRRHGFCPLYPAACALFTLVFILTAKLYTNMADGALAPIGVTAVLAGNLAGAARRRMKRGKGAETP